MSFTRSSEDILFGTLSQIPFSCCLGTRVQRGVALAGGHVYRRRRIQTTNETCVLTKQWNSNYNRKSFGERDGDNAGSIHNLGRVLRRQTRQGREPYLPTLNCTAQSSCNVQTRT